MGRNTAPAIALAALQATQNGDDPLMLVLAADHIINNQQVFHDAIRVAEQYAQADHLVTFGIVPNTPKPATAISSAAMRWGREHTPYQVARFVEKPDLERAQVYLASGEYYWNSGMFMFRAKSISPNWQNSARIFSKSARLRSAPPTAAATLSASRMRCSAPVPTNPLTMR